MVATVTVEAIYQSGVIKPLTPLDLRENERIKIQIEREPLPKARPAASLRGAFPELAAISDEDIEWAKGLWERGVEKQARILAEQE